jgi:DNA-binding NarL/FixJ family response regulator
MTVLIAETSYIIRKGFTQLLREFTEVEQIIEAASDEDFQIAVNEHSPHIVIANTSFNINPLFADLEEGMAPVVLYLFNSPLPPHSPTSHLSIHEEKASLKEKIETAIEGCRKNVIPESEEELSPREKLVLKQVAIGLTNKEIADKLFISTHTVISHRKNITRKLGIKTVSGLTVYAILNKLISLEDIS